MNKEITMKAIVYEKYGPPEVLQLKEVGKPIPKEDEVLVKVHAASLNAGDWHALRGEPFLQRLESGLPNPKKQILGADVAGRVEAVGRNVTGFQLGDEIYGDL
jgi:NADPH:quinone reductase-like Zn-dependent oxidoreductase